MMRRLEVRSSFLPRAFTVGITFGLAISAVGPLHDQLRRSLGRTAALWVVGVGLVIVLLAAVMCTRRGARFSEDGIELFRGFNSTQLSWSDVTGVDTDEYQSWGTWFRWARFKIYYSRNGRTKTAIATRSYRRMDDDLLVAIDTAPYESRSRLLQGLNREGHLTAELIKRLHDLAGLPAPRKSDRMAE